MSYSEALKTKRFYECNAELEMTEDEKYEYERAKAIVKWNEEGWK